MGSHRLALRSIAIVFLFLAGQGSALAALAGDAVVNQWFEFSNSKMESAFPGTAPVMTAWSGGIYDSDRDQLVVWVGGHADYSGNEVYAFGPLSGTNPVWKRLTNPSNPPANNTPYAPDGRPVSRHTMAVLDYLPAPYNKMISCGIPSQYSNGYSAEGVDFFDFTINGLTGQPWSVGATPPSTEYASMAACAYNPVTQRVWFQDAGSSRSRLQQYNPATNTWTAHAENSPTGTTVAAIDPTRNLFVWLEAGVGLRVFDLNSPDAPPFAPTTSGASNPQTAYAPGFVYDPVNNRFISWHGGTTLYSLSIPSNPKTGTWAWSVIPLAAGNAVTPSGPTTSSGGYETGTYGRFRYVAALHGVVVVSASDESVYFRKLDGTAGSPAPTVTFSASPLTIATGESSTLTWSSTNAVTCTASGTWNDAKATAGTYTATTAGTYTLTCSGAGGSAAQQISISAADPGTDTDTGAGGGTGTDTTTESSKKNASGPLDVIALSVIAMLFWRLRARRGKNVSPPEVALIVIGGLLLAGGPGVVHAGDITTVTLTHLGSTAQPNAVVTFGHYFRAGDVPSGSALAATTSSGAAIQLQVDKKSTHADGSLRHAILTAKLPALAGNGGEILTLSTATSALGGAAVALSDVLATTFDAQASLNMGGTVYSASAKTLLSSGTPQVWLSGPLVSEWIVGGPVKTSGGTAHAHLTAYFHVRAYAGSPITQVRVDAVVENNWSFKTGATAFTYVPTITVGGATIYNNSGASLTHYHHSRWHQVGWWGGNPQVVAQPNRAYLRNTKGVPNYADLAPQEIVLSSYQQNITPMSRANLRVDWPDTGYDPQIGVMPEWYASYIMSGDIRTYKGVLANDSAGGSYSYHYRDENTGLVPSINTYPNLSEQYPETGLVAGTGGNQFSHDDAHAPLVGYLGYVLTGDYYYLEELQFLANYHMLYNNYIYRQYEKGVLSGQNRSMAWGMRTIAAAAAITPDSSPLKNYFVTKINNNIDDRAVKWSLTPANNLGAIQDYNWNPPSSTYYSPWQNSFFVASVNWAYDLGFTSSNALSLRNWFNKWPTGLMGQDNNGFCPYYAGEYNFSAGIVDGSNGYRTFLQLYQAQYPVESALPCPTTGLMRNGYSELSTGYYSNMQPALAMAVDSGVATQATWDKFVSLGTPDYSAFPVWGIVPRATGSAAPSVTLVASPSSVSSGGSTSLIWSAVNAASCTASGSWSGTKGPTGNEAVSNITSASTFALSCAGSGGEASTTATVTIATPGGSGSDADSGSSELKNSASGGGSFDRLFLGMLVLWLSSWRAKRQFRSLPQG